MSSLAPARVGKFRKYFPRYKYAYLLLIPGIVMTIIFRYIPMYGIIMAFEKFRPGMGIFRSPFVGFANFAMFFKDPYSLTLVRNTFLLGLYTLIFAFPVPICWRSASTRSATTT